jgi:hypothetical protein
VTLFIEPGRQTGEHDCPHCGVPVQRANGFVSRDGVVVAAFFASCYHHDDHDIWIDVILGTWGSDDHSDHVTFGCRVGPVEGQSEPASTLVAAAAVMGDDPVFGHKLSREEALRHPRLDEFWELADHLLVADELVAPHFASIPRG